MRRIEFASDLNLSQVALGFWRVAEWGITAPQLCRLLEQCAELGITTYDHADIYANGESLFGEARKSSSLRREDLQIITKNTIVYKGDSARVKYYDSSRKHIVEQLEESLKNLKTDYVDLLLLHRPDPHMDCSEVAAAFRTLRDSGKVLHFGVSNYAPSQYATLQNICGEDLPLVTNQVQASALHLDPFLDGTIDQLAGCRRHPIFWSPLAGGRLFDPKDEQACRVRKTLLQLKNEVGATTIDEVALAFLQNHPIMPVTITGADDIEFVRRAAAATDLHLSAEQWFMIWTASTGVKVP